MLFFSASWRVPWGSRVDKSIKDNFMDGKKLIFFFQHLFCYRLRLFLFPSYHLHQHRRRGCNNNPKNHVFKVTLYPIVFPQEIPQGNQAAYPQDPPHNIIKGEFLEIHFYDTSHNGSECTHYGEKARQDNGYPTSFFIKLLRTEDVFLFKKPVILHLQ